MIKNKKEIFITYAEAGAGHWKAAEAIYKEMQKNATGYDICLINSFEKSGPFMVWVYNWSYLFMVAKIPWMWGASYYSLDNRYFYRLIMRHIRRLFNAIVSIRLVKFLIDENPDLIVCTHFHMLEVASYLKRKGKITGEIICVITDYAAHNFWLEKEVNLYIVGHRDTKNDLISRGIIAKIIKVIGIPVEDKFLTRKSAGAIRERFDLKKDNLTALIVSGGFGVGPIEKIVLSLKEETFPVQLIVVCGKNQKLLDRIKGLTLPENITIKSFGFVDNLDEFMDVSDIIVSKSGGLITSEAIVKKLPMIIFSPIPGQEEKNCQMIIKNNLGIKLDATNEFPGLIKRLINEPSYLEELKQNVTQVSDPMVTGDIVKAIYDHARS